MENISKQAILLLEDGTAFYGKAAGKIGTTTGEICFNTGMTGYQEVFTDPSYFGQITIMTSPHIGNYGTVTKDQESSSVKIKGLVTKSFSEINSRAISDISLQEYFENENVVSITDVDTRQIVKYIRDKGVMNAIISSEISDIDHLKKKLSEVPSMQGLELASKVSTNEKYIVGNGNSIKVSVLDLGIKQNIINSLVERDCECHIFPSNSSFNDLSTINPNGYFLSNGPGDPASMRNVVATVKEIINQDKPVFGICLGHQMLAEANGVSTFKMHNGHRGLNHPVKNLLTGKSEVTSQNHGFAVKLDDLSNHSTLEVTHVNLNDNTVEGMRMKDKSIFSVQYHPESNPGPHDSRYLFDDFISMMK